VTSRITKGHLVKASVKANFKPGELKLNDTPDQAIDAMIEVAGATVQYMPKHPPVSEVNGVVKFTGKTMDAKVTHAKYMTDTQVTSATIRFPDLNAADVRLFLDMDVNAPAKDVVAFMSLPDLDKAKKLNLNSSVTGKASGNAKLDFIAFSDTDDEKKSPGTGHINYAIAANLINVSQAAFMGNRDVDNANMKVNLNNKGIKALGKAKINQVPMNIDLTTSFARDHETTYAVRLDMPVARLPDFGLPKLDFAKGTMGVNAKFISSDTADEANATLDLTHTEIGLPEHGFLKKMGDKATLELATSESTPGKTLIKSFLFTEGDGTASGKGEFDKAANDFSTLTFDVLRIGNHDLTYLDYEKSAEGIKLAAKGHVFDLSPYLSKVQSKKPDETYDIDIKTDRLILGEKREMKDVTVQADCGRQCRSANINATLPNGSKFVYTISHGELSAACDNAGQLIKVLGIFDGIEGGKMLLSGTYKEDRLEGRMEMQDYTLKNAPTLTKIITIASFTGILDTLTGNGIYFSRLSAPFVYRHDVLVLKEAKAHGSALGITADGVIDIPNSKINLSGTLVPSYTMNSLIGNIPLIGEMLVGHSGGGIIAINYSVKGDTKDPSISVNPLSVLTPGFLRGIFNIFDEPAPDFDKIDAERKKAEEKKAGEKAPVTPEPSAKPSTLPSPDLLKQ